MNLESVYCNPTAFAGEERYLYRLLDLAALYVIKINFKVGTELQVPMHKEWGLLLLSTRSHP